VRERDGSIAFALSVTNRFDQPVGLAIEPWGDQCVMVPGDVVHLQVLALGDAVPEFVIDRDGVTLIASGGMTCSGWRDGLQVLHGETPFPEKGIDVLRRIGLFGANKQPVEDS